MNRTTRLYVSHDPGGAWINWGDSLTKSLLHWFPLNEPGSSRLITDLCGRAKTAPTWTGTITNTGGKFGRAMLLPATSTSINTNYSIQLPVNALTVSCWLRPSFAPAHWTFPLTANGGGTASDQFAISYSDNVTGAPKFEISNSAGTSFGTSDGSTAMVENTWNNVVGVFDGATVTVYLNGTQGAQAAAVATINNSQPTQRLIFGDNSVGTAWHAGGMAHVGIWNRALNAAEVRRLYSEPLAPLYMPGRPLFVPTIAAAQDGSATESGLGSIAGAAVERMIGSTLRW